VQDDDPGLHEPRPSKTDDSRDCHISLPSVDSPLTSIRGSGPGDSIGIDAPGCSLFTTKATASCRKLRAGTLTSPQSNLRRACRSSADETSTRIANYWDRTALACWQWDLGDAKIWLPCSAALLLLSQWTCCVCFVTFLHMNFSSTPMDLRVRLIWDASHLNWTWSGHIFTIARWFRDRWIS